MFSDYRLYGASTASTAISFRSTIEISRYTTLVVHREHSLLCAIASFVGGEAACRSAARAGRPQSTS